VERFIIDLPIWNKTKSISAANVELLEWAVRCTAFIILVSRKG